MPVLERLGRDVIENRRRLNQRRHLKVPKLAVGARRTERALWFVVPDWSRPAGGLATIYRHVDMLNASGIRASVVHQRRGFRLRWFDNATPVVPAADAVVAPDDVVVVPEVCSNIDAVPVGIRRVVFDQSGHLAWARAGRGPHCYSARDPWLVGVLTVSERSCELLRHALPAVPVTRVRLSVDAGFAPGVAARRRIAYMPRRGGTHVTIALDILRSRGTLRGWELLPIENVPHPEMPDLLRSAQLFVTASELEGFGLPAAEAMASGCYVVGYDGFGGREFFQPAHSSPVPNGDVLGLARALEEAVKHSDQWRVRRGLLAARFVRRRYPLDQERDDVVRYYGTVLDGVAPWTRGPASSRHGPAQTA